MSALWQGGVWAVLCAYAVALTFLFISYEYGGRVWILKHCIILGERRTRRKMTGVRLAGFRRIRHRLKLRKHVPRPPKGRLYRGWILRQNIDASAHYVPARPYDQSRDWRRCISGFWGEGLVATLAVTTSVIVMALCDRASFQLLMTKYPLIFAGLGVAAALGVGFHCHQECARARKAGRSKWYCRRQSTAYSIYTVYAWLLFAFGAIILGMLWLQFWNSQATFNKQQSELMATMDSAVAAASKAKADRLDDLDKNGAKSRHFGQAMSDAEDALEQIAVATNTLQEQLNPAFIFAALLIAINIAITHTPVRVLYVNDGRKYTLLFTVVPMALVVFVAGYVYISSYEHMLREVGSKLIQIRPDPVIGDWAMMRRHSEMVTTIDGDRNIIGFAVAMSGKGSGAALIAGIAEWFLGRYGKEGKSRQLQTEPADDSHLANIRQPTQRFRPIAG